MRPITLSVASTILCLTLAGCGGGGGDASGTTSGLSSSASSSISSSTSSTSSSSSNSSSSASSSSSTSVPPTFSLGGTVSGLSGTVILQNNGANNLSLTANGTFSFATGLASGAGYNVTVLTQPASQTCTVVNGTGTISANVTAVVVTCVARFSLGGTVTGLNGTVILQTATGDRVTVTLSGAFTFPVTLAAGSSYGVSVAAQPSSQACVVSNGSGSITANVTNVVVACSTSFVIGGNVTGLVGNVVLQLNGANDFAIASNGSFSFQARVPASTSYAVSVATHPTGQFCSTANDSGTASGNVATVLISCGNVPAPTAGYGTKRLLLAHAKFSDTGADPFPVSDTEARMVKVRRFFLENSYGASAQTYEVKPWLTLPNTKAYYQQQDALGKSLWEEALRQVALASDLTNVDIVGLVVTPIALGYPGCFEVANTVSVPSGQRLLHVVVLATDNEGTPTCPNAGLMSHEIGHAYGPTNSVLPGFWHSSDLSCKTWPGNVPPSLTDPTYSATDCAIPPGTNGVLFDYAHYDFMGSYRGHTNVYWKRLAGWLTGGQVAQLGNGGVTTLEAIELATPGIKGAEIPLGSDQVGDPASYWLEYRSQRPVDLDNSAAIPVGDPDKVKVWVNLSNLPPEPIKNSSVAIQSKVYSFWEFTNGPAYTDIAVGGVFTDPFRGVRVSRGANASGAVPTANVTVAVANLHTSPTIGALLSANASQTLTVSNTGTQSIGQGVVRVAGRNASSFQIVSDNCSNASLGPAQTCQVVVSQVRNAGDTAKKFAHLEWTSTDPIRPTPTVGLIGNP